MENNKHFKYIVFLFVLILFLFGGIVTFKNIIALNTDISNSNARPVVINDELYKSICQYGEKHMSEPIDAKIDRVWKAIPGYNGKKVDVEASYKVMIKDGIFDVSKIIYIEIPPKVHLDDLGPEPIYRGNFEKPMAAPLINVAWGNEYIPKILDTLNKHQLKVTFFFDGSWVKKNQDVAKLIKEEGHEIGNHAYSHPDLSSYSIEQTKEEILKTNAIIEETVGVKPIWFAPPSGSFNKNTIQVAQQLNMKTILWTVDTIDWKNPETNSMVKRVTDSVGNGSMILMHPTKPTAEGLDTMITRTKEKGYKLGTVSELMNEKRID